MKKLILVLAFVFASGSLVNANNTFEIEKSKKTNNLIETDDCQEVVGAVIRFLDVYSSMSHKELADLESEMLGNCYYDA